jgi:hypothetical protein
MSEGAPERGGGDRGEEDARGSLERSESTDYADGLLRFRRAIVSVWRCLAQEEEREMEEVCEGVL